MKAARFYDKGDIRIEEIAEPVVEPGTVGIKVAWCGICGTDLHEFMEGPIFIPPCGHPHPVSGECAPITMGHEFSGVVYAVGEGVDDIQVGQHVVVEPYIVADDVPTGEGDMKTAVFMLFAVTALLSMWISNTATTAMMLPLVMGMMTHLDKEKERNTFVFVLLGTAYCSSIGGLGTLIGSPPNAIAAKALDLSFNGWIKMGLPIMLLILPLTILLLYIILRPNLNQRVELQSEHIPWTPHRIIALLIFILTALSWILSSKIKAVFGINNPDTVIALTAAVAVALLGVAHWKEIARNTDWGVLMLFGGGICLSNLMRASGASVAIGQQIASVFAQSHILIVIFVVAAFIIFLTELTSNTASAALLVPIFAGVAAQMGLPKEVLVFIIGIGASCAFMLPVATPPNAIVFGTGLIKQKEMMRVGLLLNTLCIILVSLWAYVFYV